MADQVTRDRRCLCTAAFLRAFAVGLSGVLIALHLATKGLDSRSVGALVSLGLAGSAGWALLAMLFADRVGRRRFLIVLSIAMIAGGVALVLLDGTVALGAAFMLGALNGMGRDRGAGPVIEQAALPSTTSPAQRTQAFAWYNVLQDAGHAFGALCAGLPVLLGKAFDLDRAAGTSATLWLAPAAIAIAGASYLGLSDGIESKTPRKREPMSRDTRARLWKISSLFALDSLAGGLLTTALLSYFFFERFGVGVGELGLLFFGARVLNALSHLAAAWLARRIGLVNTMVFTHIPSSLLLVTVAIAPNFPVAAVLFLLREGLVEMDVPTRQSYVMAVVREDERTLASGVTNVVRMASWSVGPVFAGYFMRNVSLYTPLIIGAAMKILYDILLYAAFRGVRPPEET